MIKHIKQILKQFVHSVANPLFVLFLFISFVLWFLNKLNHTYNTTVTIPVGIVSRFDSSVGVASSEQYIDCQVSGIGYRLLRYKLMPSQNVVSVDIKNLEIKPIESSTKSEVTIPSLFNALSNQISDVRVLAILSPHFEITTAKLKSKLLPVLSQITINPDRRYIATGEVVLSPCSVEVKSLSAILDTLRGIETQHKVFNNVRGSVSGVIPLETPPDVVVSVKEVKYSASVWEFTQVDLLLPIEVRNAPAGLTPIVIPQQAHIKLNVPRERYSAATAENIKLYVDYAERATNLSGEFKVHCSGSFLGEIKEISPLYVTLLFEVR